jgi:hypothetical protein
MNPPMRGRLEITGLPPYPRSPSQLGLSYITDGGENLSYNDVTDGRSDMSIWYLTGSCKNRITCPDSILHFTPR